MQPPPAQPVGTPEHLIGRALSCFWLGLPAGDGRFMLVGALDLVTADRARAEIHHAQHETRALICDLGDVWFIDFSGLRVLLEATARARLTGARLTVAHPPPLVPRMLALLKLQDALEIDEAPRLAAPLDPHLGSTPFTSPLEPRRLA